jgi:nucleotide-binding universal stress UspA family protein
MAATEPFLIVVGVDGSAHSLAALEWAITEARMRQGRIRLITAWYYPPLASTVGDGVIDDTFKQAAERAHARAVAAVADAGVPVTGQVVENSPGVALLHAAPDADLVIVGAHGHGGLAGGLLGSVAAHVIHHARCSVLIARA